jgi:hypothetical protein
MAQHLSCDATTCGEYIQDGTERIDVTLPSRQDEPSGQVIAGSTFNFHTTCYRNNGALIPDAGLCVIVTRVPATASVSAPVASALPEPLRAP